MQRFLVDLERGQVLEQGDTHGVLTQRPASRLILTRVRLARPSSSTQQQGVDETPGKDDGDEQNAPDEEQDAPGEPHDEPDEQRDAA